MEAADIRATALVRKPRRRVGVGLRLACLVLVLAATVGAGLLSERGGAPSTTDHAETSPSTALASLASGADATCPTKLCQESCMAAWELNGGAIRLDALFPPRLRGARAVSHVSSDAVIARAQASPSTSC